jgi:hypothetical protein
MRIRLLSLSAGLNVMLIFALGVIFGSDNLSMAVIPRAIALIRGAARSGGLAASASASESASASAPSSVSASASEIAAASASASASACSCTVQAGVPWASPTGSGFMAERQDSDLIVARAIFAARHMLKSLPSDWLISVLVAPSALGAYADGLHAAVCAGRVHLWGLDSDSYSVTRVCLPPLGGNNGTSYASMSGEAWPVLQRFFAEGPLATPPTFSGTRGWVSGWTFANEVQAHPLSLATIPTDRYLVFQPDGMLCGPTAAAALNALAPYDYVGAPWPWEVRERPNATQHGNGGFSLRNKSTILRIVREFGHTWGHGAEDVFFCTHVEQVGGRLPKADVASAFSAEAMYTVPPLGFHKPWPHIENHLGRETFTTLVRECAVLQTVMESYNVVFSTP